MERLVVLGSLNADLVARVERAPESGATVKGEDFAVHCGGKGANQAYAAARLGGAASMIGRIGDDNYGREQLSNLSAAGVDIRGVKTLPGAPTGAALVLVEASGDNRIVVIEGANGAFDLQEFERDKALLEKADWALFQLETPLSTVQAGLAVARGAGARTILDPAPARPLPDAVYRHVDYLTPNLCELRLLSGMPLMNPRDRDEVAQACRLLLGRGVGCVVAKLGAEGALIVRSEGCSWAPGFAVKAIDTTAAGDCFNAAFAVALARGEPEEAAARFACAAAGLSVTRRGAQSSMPEGAEVERFLEEFEAARRPAR